MVRLVDSYFELGSREAAQDKALVFRYGPMVLCTKAGGEIARPMGKAA